MRRGKSVIGKDVLSLASGQRLDTVKDLILGSSNDAVVALLIDEGGLLSSSKIIPAQAIVSFGRDAVVVKDATSLVEASRAPELRDVVDRETKLIGTTVFTDTGDKQGKVSDVYFDDESRRVMGLEISGGGVTDIAEGRRFLSVDEIVRIGPDVLYIRARTAEELAQQQGGLKAAVGDSTERVKGAVGDGTDRLKSAAGSATDGARGAGAQLQQRVADATDKALVGKRTTRDVDDDTGAVLIEAGRQIEPEDIDLARSRGKLRDLATSVGMPEADMAGAGIGDKVGGAADTATTLWDRFTAKIGEVTDSTGKRMDEESKKRRLTQIVDAVGRPVTKVILDLDDRVILDLGDIITHAAIQRADEAGALDSLLSSVYKGDVTFAKEEMRIERAGEASLEKAEGRGVGVPVMEQLRDEVETAERQRDQEKARKRAEADADRQRRETEREANARSRNSRVAQGSASR
jgi:uncharacterized protein YrrD